MFAVRFLRVSLMLSLSCAGVSARRYSMPLSSAEGAVVVPALVSTAESLGLSAWNHQTSVEVRLSDGTRLWWMPWGTQFVLSIELAKARGEDQESAFRDAKVRADEIWTAAVQARQANNVGAAVLVPPSPEPQQRQVHPSNPPMNQPARFDAPQPQRSGLPAGASCRFSSDCAGGNCRQNVCMGQGGPGAPCWFSSDCNSNSCRDHVCR